MESKIAQLIGAESRMVVAEGWGEGEGEMAEGYKGSVMQDE